MTLYLKTSHKQTIESDLTLSPIDSKILQTYLTMKQRYLRPEMLTIISIKTMMSCSRDSKMRYWMKSMILLRKLIKMQVVIQSREVDKWVEETKSSNLSAIKMSFKKKNSWLFTMSLFSSFFGSFKTFKEHWRNICKKKI